MISMSDRFSQIKPQHGLSQSCYFFIIKFKTNMILFMNFSFLENLDIYLEFYNILRIKIQYPN